MTQLVKTAPPALPQIRSWLCLPTVRFDSLAVLSKRLGDAWIVQRETDYEGEVSIVVLAADDNAMPSFVLYERDGLAHVAVVQDDEWRTRPGFVSAQEAVAAIAAAIIGLDTNGPSPEPISAITKWR